VHDSLGKVVYAIHHPYFNNSNLPLKATTWGKEFGYLVTSRRAPVVVGEWTNFTPNSADKHAQAYCWPHAPTQVRQFLSYLASLRVGLSGYQLAAGLLITAEKAWTSPTRYSGTWSSRFCTSSPRVLGAGADIRNWFSKHD